MTTKAGVSRQLSVYGHDELSWGDLQHMAARGIPAYRGRPRDVCRREIAPIAPGHPIVGRSHHTDALGEPTVYRGPHKSEQNVAASEESERWVPVVQLGVDDREGCVGQ